MSVKVFIVALNNKMTRKALKDKKAKFRSYRESFCSKSKIILKFY